MRYTRSCYALLCLLAISACSQDSNDLTDGPAAPACEDAAAVDPTRPNCHETLVWDNQVTITTSGDVRVITSNGIPDHLIGLFGHVNGALNPNAVSEQHEHYEVPLAPVPVAGPTWLLSASTGPQYSFGIMLNGVELDPEAAEPWPHVRGNLNNVNWEWNLDAMTVNLGLDCNNAHVQPSGKYHYHGSPTRYLQELGISSNAMTLIGYAADGFPIYYKYGYVDAGIKTLQSSYRLKSGDRPGDGESAPCGPYTGIYTADYELVPGLGDLDACNGREGVTPEYPDGTYYYVITETYPYIGRCLVGTPSHDFAIHP